MVHKTHDKLAGLVSKWLNHDESQSVGLKEEHAGHVKVTEDHVGSVLAVDKAIVEIQKFEKVMLGEAIEEKSFEQAQEKITAVENVFPLYVMGDAASSTSKYFYGTFAAFVDHVHETKKK